ncbi:hypothetical protein [Peribacillus frigoritolerans]|uniref:hypothetical protein n=1 Tax=Peribacillus frigoritolerans TaxID=450367 RepID=UPI0025A1B19F|nr:hypothetical protein [Peribacillus frigoritolerans]MDM5305816.1 hypothetical protein [Peribacillus frigoritolerans]
MTLDSKDIFLKEIPENIYIDLILGNDVWYFENVLGHSADNSSKVYDSFKRLISRKLDIHFNNICIVGSAKTGFSFKKGQLVDFRHIQVGKQKASDIDIAVISEKWFQRFWDIMLEMKMHNRKIGKNINDYNYACSSIFRKFAIPELLPETYDEVKEWNSQVESLLKDFQTIYNIPHTTSFRLYESWDALKNYQLGSIIKVKEKFTMEDI